MFPRIRLFCILITLFLCSYNYCFAGYAEQIVADGPVAWWRLDDYRYKDDLPAVDEMGNVRLGYIRHRIQRLDSKIIVQQAQRSV